jgi:hypothetical protein
MSDRHPFVMLGYGHVHKFVDASTNVHKFVDASTTVCSSFQITSFNATSMFRYQNRLLSSDSGRA